jgi:hypothetical protein
VTGAFSSLFIGMYIIVYMIKEMDYKLLEDDVIYLAWSSLFLVFYMLFSGGVSTLASAVFVKQVFKQFNN